MPWRFGVVAARLPPPSGVGSYAVRVLIRPAARHRRPGAGLTAPLPPRHPASSTGHVRSQQSRSYAVPARLESGGLRISGTEYDAQFYPLNGTKADLTERRALRRAFPGRGVWEGVL